MRASRETADGRSEQTGGFLRKKSLMAKGSFPGGQGIESLSSSSVQKDRVQKHVLSMKKCTESRNVDNSQSSFPDAMLQCFPPPPLETQLFYPLELK